MVVFAHIYTSFIDSRGTDPSVVYLRSHHVIQDFFLLLPENLSTLRYLIKIIGWLDSNFWTVLFFFNINHILRPLSFQCQQQKSSLGNQFCLTCFLSVRPFVILSFCHWVIESRCLTCSSLSLNENHCIVFLHFFFINHSIKSKSISSRSHL